MPDPRFFEDLGPVSLVELAAITGAILARPEDGERRINTVAPLIRGDQASAGFFSDKRYLEDLKATRSGACFLAPAFLEFAPDGCAPLIHKEPHAAYSAAAGRLHRPRLAMATDPAIHPSAQIEDGVVLAPGVIVGADAEIGRGTSIGSHSVIGPGVAIGRGCAVGSHVTIGFALIGDHCSILSGAVIGEPGFGVTMGQGRTVDVPQLGRVIIQDNVSIGACTCVDRGAWDDTVIGENTKIDNLVQIAHNVRIGRNCLIAAHTGISGSCVIGDGVHFGGQAGIADHLHIGDGARIGARAGVMQDIPAREVWAGTPARPIRRWLRESALIAKLASAREGSRE